MRLNKRFVMIAAMPLLFLLMIFNPLMAAGNEKVECQRANLRKMTDDGMALELTVKGTKYYKDAGLN